MRSGNEDGVNGRLAEFDVLRTVALGMILACHFVEDLGLWGIGSVLGLSGNFVFFMMSGALLGRGWKKAGEPPYGWAFLRHRLLRLAVPLWLFVVPWFVFLLLRGASISIKTFLLHMTLLNWVAHTAPGMFATWFVTAICVFYALVAVATHLRAVPWLLWCAGLVVAQILASLVGLHQAYFFLHLGFAFLAFFKGEALLAWMRRRTEAGLSVMGVGFVMVGIVGEGVAKRLGWTDPALHSWVCYMPVAVGVVSIVFTLSRGRQVDVFIRKASELSYEAYLVHMAVLLIVRPLCSHVLVYASGYLLVTFAVAGLLHGASAWLFSFAKRRLA